MWPHADPPSPSLKGSLASALRGLPQKAVLGRDTRSTEAPSHHTHGPGPASCPGHGPQAVLSSPRSPCSHLNMRERGGENFPSSVPGDSEESKVCSKLVLLLLSFLSLSREARRLGEICLPHTRAWSQVLTACFPCTSGSLAPAQAPRLPGNAVSLLPCCFP